MKLSETHIFQLIINIYAYNNDLKKKKIVLEIAQSVFLKEEDLEFYEFEDMKYSIFIAFLLLT